MYQRHKLVIAAKDFAHKGHASINQVRKYTGEPYINHPAEVVALLSTIPHTPEMLAAAWMHDLVEDVPLITDSDIREMFGDKVADLVAGMTEQSTLSMGNRAVRKNFECKRLGAESAECQSIKLADLISNCKSIVANDVGFGRVYVREFENLLQAMDKGDPSLRKRAFDELNAAKLVLSMAPTAPNGGKGLLAHPVTGQRGEKHPSVAAYRL